MTQESVLIQELQKLEIVDLKKIANLWNLNKITAKEKKAFANQLLSYFQQEFYLKGVLEKLTALQVTIYTSILKNKNVMTLGEISRKISLPPINVEMELNVLKKHFLIYQRKNRERLTNNLDKYHAYDEIASLVKVEQNSKGEKYKISLEKDLKKLKNSEIEQGIVVALHLKKTAAGDEVVAHLNEDGLAKIIGSLDDLEKTILQLIYVQGGVIQAEVARSIIHVNRGKFDSVIPSLISKYLVYDQCFIEEKFVRVLVIPAEIMMYLEKHPILPLAKKGTKQRQEKTVSNDLDFFLNIKKLISYISRKGLNLAKSGKIKQADHKRTEMELLQPDLGLFPEKSQIYQIELILPILRLLGFVEEKDENVILVGEHEQFLKKDIFEIMNMVIHEVNEARMRRLNPPEVFAAIDVPFYEKIILDKCVNMISNSAGINVSVIFSNIIREHLILSPGFKVKNFETDLSDLKKEIISALFYLNLFGLMKIEYPSRNLFVSDLGYYYFHSKTLPNTTEKGGITINPDFSIIAFPDRVSMKGIYLLKAFTELKDYDRVYTFVLTKDAFQLGILLGHDPSELIHFLRESSKAELAQNLLFLLEDWGQNLPIVTIIEGCVLLKTSDSHVMELLLGQIKGKKIVIEEISPTAILIDKTKVQDVIASSEKLNLIIQLIR